MFPFGIEIDPECCIWRQNRDRVLQLASKSMQNRAVPCVELNAEYDLRQDQLTLQLIKLMAKMWRRQHRKEPLHMSPYAVAVTGPDMGILEVVQDAETTGAINREAGGARQVLRDSTLADWLRKQCDDDDAKFRSAQHRFAMSAAGYCTFDVDLIDLCAHCCCRCLHVCFGNWRSAQRQHHDET